MNNLLLISDLLPFWYVTLLVFIIGACFGSFLNVCIYRIPAELSVVKPRSRCPKCLTNLSWKDNLPILGWIFLRGKCRYCKAPIAGRYPLVELLTAVLVTWIWLRFPYSPLLIPYWILMFGLILGSFVDLDEMWIPDRCTIGGMILGPIFSFFIPAMHHAETHLGGLVPSLVGLAVGFGLLWSVGFIGKLVFRKDAMGFGDVKLMGALGAFLGWPAVLFIIFISSVLGSIVGVSLIAAKKTDLQSRIPFGPYIAMAALIWVLGGSTLWGLYINWMFAAGGM